MVLLWLGIRPKAAADRGKLDRALATMQAANPWLEAKGTADGRVLVGAGSDAQLDAAIGRLVHEFGVQADVTGIDIAYKEALTRAAVGEAKCATQSGGRSQYAHVKIEVEPGEPGSGFVFDNATVGEMVPGEFIEPIVEGLRQACDRGVLAGYPIDDVRVMLYDGSYHDVDSSADAFRTAAAMAFLDAAKRAQPVLLEPIMNVALIVPDEHASRAEAILSARRGVLLAKQSLGEWPTLVARLPLSETFGLAGEVRARTAGRGICDVSFAQYAPAARAEDGGDRDAPVREPKPPRTPPRLLRAAVAEPADDAWGDDEALRRFRE